MTGVALSYMPTPVNVPADAEYTYYDLGICGPLRAGDDGVADCGPNGCVVIGWLRPACPIALPVR